MKRYVNYHKHSHYSNIKVKDCVVKPIDYINRALELGHKEYVTTEHGFQGNIFEAHELCEKNGLRCIYGVEAYYTDNIEVKERKNYHIVVIALNKRGIQSVNRIMSIANTEGYYYRPRVNKELMLSLNREDVIVTTACVASPLFKEDNWLEEFFIPFKNYFQNHFFLEIQSHDTPLQIEYNKKIYELHKEYNVELIHANDSHYIFPNQKHIRSQYIKAKGVDYPDEENFEMDYPDYDEIVRRYKNQGIISDEDVIKALENTLIIDNADTVELDKEFKLPKLFKDKDSNKILQSILIEEIKNKLPYNSLSSELRIKYEQAINYEFEIIQKCGMADYFILDYFIVKKAIEEYGAVITRSGRGSAVSFYINYLLGFTQVDRLKSPIKLYPTRFMSAERILNSRSLPDIDLNFADVEPVLKASKDYMGEDGVYYMVSYKPLQDSSAFRLWCKSLGMNINEYDNIAKNLDEYSEHEKWGEIIEDSKVFKGTIESVSPSPCSVLLLDKPISSEIGLIRVGKENSTEHVMCCVLDGIYCDKYKYLKNDYLIVTVYSIINDVYKLIGRKIDDIPQLLKNCNDKVWDIYEKGLTTTINQADSDFDKQVLMRYKPKTLEELSGYVAAIRPGFSSLLNTFIDREPYSTGVKELDNLLEDSFHFMLYQESIMSYLIWLGINEKETYDIIKKISKKIFTDAEQETLRKELFKDWKNKGLDENLFNATWKVVDDASRYSFNASHSLCVAIDSLYGAYLKSHYPLEYFTVVFDYYAKDIKRTKNLKNELLYFDISLKPIKYGVSKFKHSMVKETREIYKGIGSIKKCNEIVADELYDISKKSNTRDFVEFLKLASNREIKKDQMKSLITLNFFSEFGENQYLLDVYNLYIKLIGKSPKKQINKNKIEDFGIPEYIIKKYSKKETPLLYKELDIYGIFNKVAKTIERKSIPVLQQMTDEEELLGYVEYTNEKFPDNVYFVKNDFKVNSYGCPKMTIRRIKDGEEITIRIKYKKVFSKDIFDKNDILKIHRMKQYFKKRPNANGEWEAINELEWILEDYEVIKRGDRNRKAKRV